MERFGVKMRFEKALLKAMDNPMDWQFGSYTADHKPTNIRLWICNIWFLDFSVCDPSEIKFNLYWRFKLWFKLQEVRKRQVVLMLEKQELERG